MLLPRDRDLLGLPLSTALPELWEQLQPALRRCMGAGEDWVEPLSRIRVQRPAPFRATTCEVTCARIAPLDGAGGGVLCTLHEVKAPWPDLILLDIGMPGLNGSEACQSIRQQRWAEQTILVALTGWAQDEARRRSEAAGFTHHLVKPVSPDALEALLGPLRG